LDFDPMLILRATSILGGQKEDKEMICNITPDENTGCCTVITIG